MGYSTMCSADGQGRNVCGCMWHGRMQCRPKKKRKQWESKVVEDSDQFWKARPNV